MKEPNGITYEVVKEADAACIRDLCNELMAFQQSKATIHPEFFDKMSYDSRVPSTLRESKENFILVAKDGDKVVGYAYSNIADKHMYSGGFATLQCDAFFDFDSVEGDDVGCLSQFYLDDAYRGKGIGSELFSRSMAWLAEKPHIKDIFIFVSNGNEGAHRFYTAKGFKESHKILDGFITVLRNF